MIKIYIIWIVNNELITSEEFYSKKALFNYYLCAFLISLTKRLQGVLRHHTKKNYNGH